VLEEIIREGNKIAKKLIEKSKSSLKKGKTNYSDMASYSGLALCMSDSTRVF